MRVGVRVKARVRARARGEGRARVRVRVGPGLEHEHHAPMAARRTKAITPSVRVFQHDPSSQARLPRHVNLEREPG